MAEVHLSHCTGRSDLPVGYLFVAGKPEKKGNDIPPVFRDGMTIAEFGKENGLPDGVDPTGHRHADL